MVKIFNDYKHLALNYYSEKVFVAFDTETTGLKASEDFMIEIGAVKFDCGGMIGEPFDMLIKPPVLIPPMIENLTHITNNMVQDCPEEKEALIQFLKYITSDNTILVAHNAPFDLGFINTALERNHFPRLNNTCIDTLQAARWAYPELKLCQQKGQYKLQSLAQRFNLQVKAAHRAFDDAKVCMGIIKQIIRDTMDRQKDMDNLNKGLQLTLF